MNIENKLKREIDELQLLVRGLSKVSGLPAELLELISMHIDNIAELTADKTIAEPSITPPLVSNVQESTLFKTPTVKIPASDITKVEIPEVKVSEIASAKHDNIEIDTAEKIKVELVAKKGQVLSEIFQPKEIINDRPEPKRMIDVAKSLTLNDRFRFQRELFDNDALKMTETFTLLNQAGNLNKALDLFSDICPHGTEADCFPDFYLMLEEWFPENPDICD